MRRILRPFRIAERRTNRHYVSFIAQKIADLQDLNEDDTQRITSYNAYKLFGVGEKPQPKIAYQIKDSIY